MKTILEISAEQDMKELVRILAENNYKVEVERIGTYWQHKYQIEVGEDESNTCN